MRNEQHRQFLFDRSVPQNVPKTNKMNKIDEIVRREQLKTRKKTFHRPSRFDHFQ